MPGIIEGEWNIVSVLMVATTCIFLLLFFGLMVLPALMQYSDCSFPCGCREEGKPYDSFHGNIVRYLYAEGGIMYAELCNGETMRVDHFENSVPV